jgi:putative colanic acid biosynthesis acetyltransferase WcaF
MSTVRLKDYNNSWYRPGRSRAWQIMWMLFGLPILRSSLLPSSAVRVRLLRFFGARIGARVVMAKSFTVKYPWHLFIGDDCWIGEGCWIDNLTQIHLGNNVCLSQGCYLCTGNHDWSDPAFGLIVNPIYLRDCAWVGAKAVVLAGVELGECSVAAAGSVVTKDIPDYEIHAGNPAAFIKMRKVGTGTVPRMEAYKS